MTKLRWDAVGERFFETGVDRGVLYPPSGSGVAWNGLVSVTENPVGGDPAPLYLDGYKYVNESRSEEFEANLQAFTYPDEFADLDGSSMNGAVTYGQQPRRSFGLSYRTRLGNDIDGPDHAYKIHVVYNALASPSERNLSSLDDSPEAALFSWDISSRPEIIYDQKPTAHLILDSSKSTLEQMLALEDILYGTTTKSPRLPKPEEIMNLLDGWTRFEIQQVTTTGLTTLKRRGKKDLMGDNRKGLYKAPKESRLKATSTVGLYSLD